MLEAIENLLILQETDRKIDRARQELKRLDPQRERLQGKVREAEERLQQAQAKARELESRRHELEVEAESKAEQVKKYTQQQYQTKKNEEYQALTQEIRHCQGLISKLEDEQLELMEQIEEAHKEIEGMKRQLAETQAEVQEERATLDEREKNLQQELEELKGSRERHREPIDEKILHEYEQLLKRRGTNVVVSIERGVCGGCHMQLTPQVIVQCKAQKEIVFCPNCNRILYYTRGMQLA